MRDALILSGSGGAEIKRHAATRQALLLLGAVPLSARLASRYTRRALVNRVTWFFAACLAGTGVRLGKFACYPGARYSSKPRYTGSIRAGV